MIVCPRQSCASQAKEITIPVVIHNQRLRLGEPILLHSLDDDEEALELRSVVKGTALTGITCLLHRKV